MAVSRIFHLGKRQIIALLKRSQKVGGGMIAVPKTDVLLCHGSGNYNVKSILSVMVEVTQVITFGAPFKLRVL